MQKYAPVPMVAGPVSLHPAVLAAMNRDYGSSQLEADFIPFYVETAGLLGKIMQTSNQVVLMTGEGMLALWSALKSCLQAQDKVLSIGTGVFGDGIGEMAASLGCEVKTLSFPYNSTIDRADALEVIEDAIKAFKPKMITVVHCETPSGTLNNLDGLAEIKRRHDVPLLYVDAVASIGGVELNCDKLGIDLLLTGSQKCLSAPPSMSILAVSEKAWEVAAQVKYQGYDSLMPFKDMHKQTRNPYTAYWHGLAALNAAAGVILKEGLEAAWNRHSTVAEQCRAGVLALGLELFVASGSTPSPTVSAIMLPKGTDWSTWNTLLRTEGLVASGSLGPMQNKVFRLGHMGTQADATLMTQALGAIGKVLQRL